MGIDRIVLQPANELEAEEQYNLLLTQYHGEPTDKKTDPLNEIVFYPYDKNIYTYTHKDTIKELINSSTSILLKSTKEITEFLLLNSLGLSDNEIRGHFNNK